MKSFRDACVPLQVLMWAHLRGNNQGLMKIPAGAAATDASRGPVVEARGGGVTGVLDGSNNYGMVVLRKATDDAIRKAKNHGVGIVGTNNTSSSTGALG